jgi:hypothetical protein
MTLESNSTFARVIEEHLDLKRRNAELDRDMPIERYHVSDPFENHPLFKTEEQARIEETLDGSAPLVDDDLVLAWPGEDKSESEADSGEDSFWGRSRDFDWGD